MTKINPNYLNYKITYSGGKPSEVSIKLYEVWNAIRASKCKDGAACRNLLAMASSPEPYVAQRTIHSIGSIDKVLVQNVSRYQIMEYYETAEKIVGEAGLLTIASNCKSAEKAREEIEGVNEGLWGTILFAFPEIYAAVQKNAFFPAPEEMKALQSLFADVTCKIAEQYAARYVSGEDADRERAESALVAAAICSSQRTFEMIRQIVGEYSPELAAQLLIDREITTKGKVSWHWEAKYIYHFTKEHLLPSIAGKGLSALYAPPESEQPDVICFNDMQYAGVMSGYIISGYYQSDYLLRVPIELAKVAPGQRRGVGDLGDITADYLLHKPNIILPENIELVNPRLTTRAVPLVV